MPLPGWNDREFILKKQTPASAKANCTKALQARRVLLSCSTRLF